VLPPDPVRKTYYVWEQLDRKIAVAMTCMSSTKNNTKPDFQVIEEKLV